ncbi:MAG: exodeoxyribonuclease V subunit beta [Buchnera aphidicola (Meitanaphis microgallis)]
MSKKKTDNLTLQHLLNQIDNLDEAIQLLYKAENAINELAVYTIHEFCYQSLQINKFCSNILFQNKIIKKKHYLYLQLSSMFWDQYLSCLPKNIAEIIVKYFPNPNILLDNVLLLMSQPNIRKSTSSKKKLHVIQLYNELIQKIETFKNQWKNNYKEISILINKSKVNKRTYNKSNLSRWIKIITEWSYKYTKNFNIPKELKYFKTNYLTKNVSIEDIPKNEIFKIIEKFLNTNFSLKTLFLTEATKKIKKKFEEEKKKQGTFEFDDLVTFLYKILTKKNENVSNIIRKKYPVLLIDEFQDTNFQQYKIFKKIYTSKKNLCIFAGDPKQAIYNFRGANISSYIKAKKNIKNKYQLNINWRSSKEMIKSINLLFSRKKNTFLIPNINFIPIQTVYKKKQIAFKIDEIFQPAIRFLLCKKPVIKQHDYNHWITSSCVNFILFWLNKGKKKQAVIIYNKQTQYITPKDICILVNNKKEASIIQQALHEKNIKTTYLSQKNSVFHSPEALELLWIFQAILNPKNEFTLKRAISTTIIAKKSKNIDLLTKKHTLWSNLVNEFYEYLSIWENFSITNVIHKILTKHRTEDKKNNFSKYIPDVSNILHLGELLEKKYNKIKKKHILILWLENKIMQQHDIPHTDYIRSKQDDNHITIATIHKSKGLEYPIVWIPYFIASHNMYYNVNTNNNSKLNIIEKNKLSENIRLLYVALTRAVIHCCIGIASIYNNVRKKTNNCSNIHKNALGYIIQSGKKCNYQQLHAILSNISNENSIEVSSEIPKTNIKNEQNNKKHIKLENHKLTRKLEYNYEITSYSKIKKNCNSLKSLQKHYNTSINENKNTYCTYPIKLITPYTFPRGKTFGIFIHNVLKNINFHKNININWISNQLVKNNFDKNWTKELEKWIYMILNTPLNQYDLILSQLNPKNYIKELEFFLPIKNQLTDKKLNETLHIFNPTVTSLCKIFFNPIKGILTGSIDLVFKWNKKYYLVDYKSDWLGNLSSNYSTQAIYNAITMHHYNIQYQLYCIALHRYLKQRIKDYSFHKHFGGIYILFLRARDTNYPKQGLFFTLPTLHAIKKLNNIFK